jgi:hypothetical protein
MFRYLLFADSTTQLNETTMTQIEADKANGWKVTDAIKVRVENTDAGPKETTDPKKGVSACKIVLT